MVMVTGFQLKALLLNIFNTCRGQSAVLQYIDIDINLLQWNQIDQLDMKKSLSLFKLSTK